MHVVSIIKTLKKQVYETYGMDLVFSLAEGIR